MLRDSLSKFYNYWLIGKENLFYLPVIITLFLITFIFLALWVDVNYTQEIGDISFLYGGKIKDAKEILKILVSAMITMTTLVISITMVVLSLFASQLGPRLINNFLGDRVTQSFVGFFFGSIAVCLTLLMYLHSNQELSHQLKLSMSIIYALSLLNLFVLLGYVNHIIKSGVADNVVARVNKDFKNNIKSWLDPGNKDHDISNKKEDWSPLHEFQVYSQKNGYVQSVSYSQLVDFSKENNIYIKLHLQAGDYLILGESLATVSGEYFDQETVIKFIRENIIIGDHRTSAQDIRYSIRHLSEIALRALSPGINDNYTAINVVNELSGSLRMMMDKDFKENIHYCTEGHLRVKGRSISEIEIIGEAFDRIHNASQGKPDMLEVMVAQLTKLRDLTSGQKCKKVIDDKIKSIMDRQ